MNKYNLTQKRIKTFNCAYLYADGHMVVTYKEKTKDNLEYTWAEIIPPEVVNTKIHNTRTDPFTRLVLHDLGLLRLALQAEYVTYYPNNSTENSRTKGFKIDSISFNFSSQYADFVSFNIIDGLIGCGISIQTDSNYTEKYDDTKNLFRWCDYQIKQVA